MDSPPIRVLVASEVRLYREGLVESLARHTSTCVVGSVSDHDGVLKCVAELRPDVLLLDMDMQRSLAAVRALAASHPALKTVAFAVSDADRDILACAEAGVAAFVPRDGSLGDLLTTVTGVVRGEVMCSPRLAGALFRHVAALSARRSDKREVVIDALTKREGEIVTLIDAGLSNKEIAGRLGLGLATVKNHVHHILEKLRASRRSEAAALVRTMRRSELPTLDDLRGVRMQP